MPLQATSGAASYDAFGGGVAAVPNYIEDVFSTWLYTGNGSTQTITNGIDLAGKGGLVWGKNRSAGWDHYLADTAQGVGKFLSSNLTSATQLDSTSVTAFNSNGFSIGNAGSSFNDSGQTYASWTFRKQPKFFDVVTYTGNGTTQNIAHNLAGTVGCLIVKRTDTGGTNWMVYHRSLPTNDALALNTTQASNEYFTPTIFGNNTVSVAPTSTQFTVGNFSAVNASGGTYVAYLFAHNAGGFGLSGTDNVISCGSFTGTGSDVTVPLGYEPQWLLVKRASSGTDNWRLYDNMRGMFVNFDDNVLFPNLSNAELEGLGNVRPTATGFDVAGSFASSGVTYIYIAIRRGPMRTPTTGTSVFTPVQNSSFTSGAVLAGQPIVDMSWSKQKDATNAMRIFDRLRGSTTSTNNTLVPSSAAAESNEAFWAMDQQNGVRITATFSGTFNYINYLFSRAPGFFDEVCWTGDSTNPRSINHNLTVAPTLIITKKRNSTSNWTTGYDFASTTYKYFFLNDPGAANADTYASSPVYGGQPTASVFVVGNQGNMNISGDTYVSYLFASCPGVSKVFSYTGNGSSQTINCGFTGGARFVMIKRTDSTGDWVLWDSSRGMVAGTDPRLALNSTAAEVNQNWVYTTTGGFQIVTSDATVNASGGSYIYLSIA